MRLSTHGLDRALLERACRRANEMDTPYDGEDAEPRFLVAWPRTRADAVRGALEAYALALTLVASFDRGGTEVDLADAVANDELAVLEWHEMLIFALAAGATADIVEALAHVQNHWSICFHYSHAWTRAVARQIHKVAYWYLSTAPRCAPERRKRLSAAGGPDHRA